MSGLNGVIERSLTRLCLSITNPLRVVGILSCRLRKRRTFAIKSGVNSETTVDGR
jgi:hypothetical protein